MRYDDTLVGAVAVVFAVLSFTIAIGPWSSPYRLRTILAVSDRFGKPAARGVWLAVAIASLMAGIAILSGVRPSYAEPAGSHSMRR
ncbi:hypothetical protein [Novipirellula artificiosorum]|uniref:Uncharacterized protein n=1 Tax=Novipirellula artificiosorum TaxID=2528016 RepID=A0A5C6E0X9_9BACT|nr:hypothetical protein [Novipirellula artificiosorum]TWU40829.1 hypothetical protein Poly41_16640 [Novipirellula artificiosorum]